MIYINNLNKKLLDKKIDFIICDFDRTITTFNSNTCWNFISKSGIFRKEFDDACDATFTYYRPIELDPNISFDLKSKYMEQWTLDAIKIFDRFGINKDIFNDILSKDKGITLRKGFTDFVKLTNDNNIRFYIVSAGIYDVIKYTLEKNNILLSNVEILSNKLNFTSNGVDGINGNILHSCNKDIIDIPINSNEYGLLFGDQIEDIKVGNRFNTYNIGFCGKKDLLSTFNSNYDITITPNSSYDNISKILKKNKAL